MNHPVICSRDRSTTGNSGEEMKMIIADDNPTSLPLLPETVQIITDYIDDIGLADLIKRGFLHHDGQGNYYLTFPDDDPIERMNNPMGVFRIETLQ